MKATVQDAAHQHSGLCEALACIGMSSRQLRFQGDVVLRDMRELADVTANLKGTTELLDAGSSCMSTVMLRTTLVHDSVKSCRSSTAYMMHGNEYAYII